jgi:hypothetical protein
MRIGFTRDEPWHPTAEEDSEPAFGDDRTGGHEFSEESRDRNTHISHLLEERQSILDADGLTPRQRVQLLEQNRKTLVNVQGGHVVGTEQVVYALLAFGALVLVLLSALTAFWDLPSQVTTTFAGTVVGGLLATVAQKIGRL